jgi:hypothetical protein
MPLSAYDGFFDECDQKAPGEFRLLKAAAIIRRPKDFAQVGLAQAKWQRKNRR